MELNSLIYFSEAAKDLNFTRTAKRLFISQQNLSNHIARLEEYYNVKLFERRPHMALTYAGEVLLAYANNLRMEETNLKNVLLDIKKKEKGALHIGGSPSRSSIILPELAELFVRKYPHVELHFHYYHSDTLTKMLLDGELDFSISIDKMKHPLLVSRPLFSDSIWLMVSEELLYKYVTKDIPSLFSDAENGISIREFQALPFANIQPSHITNDVFAAAGCLPYFVMTSNYPHFLWPYHYSKIAASIITQSVYLHIREHVPKDILFFPIKSESDFELHAISFIRHKRKYLSQYGQYFLHIAEIYFQNLENGIVTTQIIE